MPRTTVLLLVAVFLVLAATGAEAEPVEVIRSSGPDENRVNVAILGDGYTRGELGKYANDVERLLAGFFRDQPFADYAAYFNVRRVNVVSNESGADHPARGVYRDTALGAHYDCRDIPRLICIDYGAVDDVLDRSLAVIARDIVLVLVNDDEYGGSGGVFPVASTNELSAELMLHELGHSFGLLADEYSGGGPACDNTVEPPEVNVTRESTAASIKWSYWIEPGTRVPATDATRGVVSAYEGAKYCDFGLYRPTFASKMRELSEPFEQVNTEQLIRRIYNLVSPIDAVSPTTAELRSDRCESLEFSVKIPGELHSLPGTLETSWRIDGEVVTTGNSLAVFSCQLPVGSHRIDVEVRDVAPAVRRDLDDALVERFRWDLETTVSSGNRPPERVGALRDRTLAPAGTVVMDVSRAFVDPDGDPLTYGASSSAPGVVTVRAAGARVTLTAASEGTATIRVTATDPGGQSATQSFTATVEARVRAPFTDDRLVPGVTPIKAVHFTELRTRIDALRIAAGLPRFAWTDPALQPGMTPVRGVHLLELRAALAEAYRAAARAAPRWTDPAPSPGTTPIRATHLMELRAAVLALE